MKTSLSIAAVTKLEGVNKIVVPERELHNRKKKKKINGVAVERCIITVIAHGFTTKQ